MYVNISVTLSGRMLLHLNVLIRGNISQDITGSQDLDVKCEYSHFTKIINMASYVQCSSLVKCHYFVASSSPDTPFVGWLYWPNGSLSYSRHTAPRS